MMLNSYKALGRTSLILAGASLLAGCASLDRFNSRAVEINNQMQSTRETLILANIMRSARDEPLQFTEFSTVNAQGSAQAGLGTVLPLFGTRANGARLFQLNPSLQMSGGPQVGIANSNTQEFFNGISAPLSIDQVATYYSNSQIRLSLLMLTVAAIDYDLNGEHYHFDAPPGDVSRVNVMQSTLIALVKKGLSFERRESVSFVGPPMTSDEVFGKAVFQNLVQAPADGKAPALKRYSMTAPEDARARSMLSADDLNKIGSAPEFYRLTTSETKTRPCFAPEANADFGYVFNPSSNLGLGSTSVGKRASDGSDVKFTIGTDYVCSSTAQGDGGGIKRLTFTFRSVRGIFMLLGEVAKNQLSATKPELYDFHSFNGATRLFGVEYIPGKPQSLASTNNVRITRGASDKSAATIQMISDFIALNSSAKSFPAPSVVPVFTP